VLGGGVLGSAVLGAEAVGVAAPLDPGPSLSAAICTGAIWVDDADALMGFAD
jgi:hypothetical protein